MISEVLIIIPARAGSKRIKNKNIRNIMGKPLIYWTIKYAKKYFDCKDIVVSSDSKKIKQVAIDEKVIFLERQKSLSGDNSNIYYTIVDVLKKINKKSYKFIALLQPTSPLRPKNLISKGIKILKKKKNFQNLIHLEKTYNKIGFLSKNNEWNPLYDFTVRGQDISNQFRPSGCLFLYLRKDFEVLKKFIRRKNYGYAQKQKIETVNIDNEEDFIKLNYFLKNNKIKKELLF